MSNRLDILERRNSMDNKEENRLSVEDAAKLMNVSGQYIRIGLQQGIFPWGNAVKMSSRWTYFISKPKFIEWTGIQC